MMKRPAALINLTLIVLFSARCGGAQARPTPMPHPTGAQVNLLVAPEEKVWLKRDVWIDYVPITFGTMLHPTDLLHVEGEALVLCADLNVKTLTGHGRCPCSVVRGVLVHHRARFYSYLRSAPPDVPYILHPRNTLVLDPHPLLRWHDTGASSYTVCIEKGSEVVWEQPDVVGDEIRYPDEAPPLQPGIDYLLVVRDNDTGRVSTEDPAKGLGLRLLGEAEQPTVEAQCDEILRALSSLDAPSRNLALAVYYTALEVDGRGLWGEALLLLDEISMVRDAPAIQLRRGELLAAVKLPGEAKAAYWAAMGSAETLGDLESQAIAHTMLWRLTGDETHLEQAVKLYEELGDKEQAETLREEKGR